MFGPKGGAMADRPDPAQLAEAIKGLSDQELEDSVKTMGVDDTLQQIFDGMQEAFVAEKAQGVDATVQYDIKSNGEVKQWTVEMAQGECKTRAGSAESPRLTLELGLVDFVRLIFGQAEGPQLFMSGKLRLKGDMMFAMQLQGLFDRPA
jgi:putative sterol carrier protein